MVYTNENLGFTFYEINEILNYMPIEYNEKLPEQIKKIITDNKIDNGFIYNIHKTLDNQEILHDTKVLLSILYRTYWCTDEKRDILEQEDRIVLEDKYNPNNVFKNNNKKTDSENKKTNNRIAIMEYKESFFKRIINKIKAYFNKE